MQIRTSIKYIFLTAILFIGMFFAVSFSYAATGTIVDGYQQSTLLNQDLNTDGDPDVINWKPTNGTAVSVTSSALTGYIWGETVGWINLGPTNGGVTNTTSGVLGGYAWGQNTGWINFAPTNGGVTISTSTGIFSGHAWSQNYGWIKFECPGTDTDTDTDSYADTCVKTSWTPTTSLIQCSNGLDDDGDGQTDYPADTDCSNSTDNSESGNPPPPPPQTCPIGTVGIFPNCVVITQCLAPNTLINGVCTQPVECLSPNTLINGVCTSPTQCLAPNTLINGVCTQPVECLSPNTLINGVCTSPTQCLSPNTLINGVCTTPTQCLSPNTLINGVCTQPVECLSPNTLINGVCTTPIEDEECPSGDCTTPTEHTGDTGGNGSGGVGSFWGVVNEVFNGSGIKPSVIKAFIPIRDFFTLKSETAVKVVSATGLAAAAFSIPFSFWRTLLALFGYRRRHPWGTVYDSVTKAPLDPAHVVLMDASGNIVTTSLTDMDGRYGFSVEPGTYTLVANKTNYVFPSTRLVGRAFDEVYSDLYFGEQITVSQKGEVILKSIPLDPMGVGLDWNEEKKRQENMTKFFKAHSLLFARISLGLFFVGFVVSLFAFLGAPTLLNGIVVGVYVVLFIARQLVVHITPEGGVVDKITGEPFGFAVLSITRPETGQVIAKKVTDATGHYYAIIPSGEYNVSISKKNADGTYQEIHTEKVVVKRGLLSKLFEI